LRNPLVIYSEESVKVAERVAILRALTGSQNSGLSDATSDTDYKYFILPNFDDLYSSTYSSASVVTRTEDYTAHDIRKLPRLLYMANPNFLEILASSETISYFVNDATRALFDELYNLRLDIFKMNLPKVFHACIGVYYQELSNLTKVRDNAKDCTTALIKTYGYDTKSAMHAIKSLDLVSRLSKGERYDSAIRYSEESKKKLLLIKSGAFSLAEFRGYADGKLQDTMKLRPYFDEKQPNEELKEEVYNIVKKIVRVNI